MSNLNPWYVTGFVDGEGTFTYSRSGKHISLYFAIKLNSKDRKLLESIQEFFGNIGKIYDIKGSFHKDGTTYSKNTCYYRVTKIEDLKQIIAHFEIFPLVGKKYFFYLVWRDIVLKKLQFYREKGHSEEFEQLAKILSEQDPKRGAR